jgi:hypothetical protein
MAAPAPTDAILFPFVLPAWTILLGAIYFVNDCLPASTLTPTPDPRVLAYVAKFGIAGYPPRASRIQSKTSNEFQKGPTNGCLPEWFFEGIHYVRVRGKWSRCC